MKKIAALFLLLALPAALSQGQSKPDAEWLESKFSMFIHFGLYSKLGGVWDGEPVRRGYSEQIQSFAGIFSDWYARTALDFNPIDWNPDSVAALAKAAGMRSVVFTAKHHDGFCMYHSKYTSYNIVDATPYGRDLMKELAEACRRAGLRFSVYFSLIDWHFPGAYPISSHNADPLTPEHYRYNLQQVEEILTGYGPIAELWFDMGSLTLEQSKGLYELVTRLQPSCMVSGRLGNNVADFAVMADNAYPDYAIGVPWQTAASMFDETWGFRSWQERGSVAEKAREKLRSLLSVISRGGNYLLNIGPDGNGAVVPFERDVLLSMGGWVSRHAEAIYATHPNPLPSPPAWGDVACKEDALYLYLYEKPAGGVIVINGINGKVKEAALLPGGEEKLHCTADEGVITIVLPETFELDPVASVVKVAFEGSFSVEPATVLRDVALTPQNASKTFAYASLDYYTGYKSLVAYGWNVEKEASQVCPKLYFTDNELGRQVSLSVGETTELVTLQPSETTVEHAAPEAVEWGRAWVRRAFGIFGAVPFEGQGLVDDCREGQGWQEIEGYSPGDLVTKPVLPFQGEFMLVEVTALREVMLPVRVVAGNSAYVLLNGEYVSAECYDDRRECSEKLLVLPLKRGRNQIMLKVYNRFAKEVSYGIQPVGEWNVHSIVCGEFDVAAQDPSSVVLKAADRHSGMVPMSLENIRIEL